MNPLLVNVAELLRRPGTDRRVDTDVRAEDLVIDDVRVHPTDAVAVGLRLESLSDGIVVTGRLTSPWHDTCRRCLVAVEGEVEVSVDELYQSRITSEDAFPIHADQIDLTPMVRELVLLDLPTAPLCRDDCAGLCPSCGQNRNDQECGCEGPVVDDRWAALDALREQLN